jgi:hypothetical protein
LLDTLQRGGITGGGLPQSSLKIQFGAPRFTTSESSSRELAHICSNGSVLSLPTAFKSSMENIKQAERGNGLQS